MTKATIFFFAFCYFSLSFSIAQNSKYKIAGKIPLDGEAGWDYLASDDSSGRLFVSHGTMVQVIDTKTKKLISTISDTKGVHGIAIVRDIQKGFISNGRDSSVTIFDLKTLSPIEKVYITGRNPDAILYDQFSHRVFVFNGKTSNATVLDALTNQVVATIPLSGKPEFAVNDDEGKIYVNIEDKDELCVINSVTLKAEKTWSVKPGIEPSGLAIDKINHRLFSVCDNKLMVVLNSLTGKLVCTLPIGENVDGCVFDSGMKRIYSSNGDGTLTVIQQGSGDTYQVIENLSTQKGARTICLNAITHHIYLPVAEYGVKPAATSDNPKPRAPIVPGTFFVFDIEPLK